MSSNSLPRPPLNVSDLAQIAELMDGELFGENAKVEGFATDSGSVRPGDLFLAIKGARVDGHNFVGSALSAGAAGSLVEHPVQEPQILVPHLVDALAKMANRLREPFLGPVVAVTGSAGKTTTKEFIAAALTPLGAILKTYGNRNTEFTAPLLWAELQPEHQAVVIEMSMRGFGQVAHLAAFSHPTVAVVTNIGFSHIEMVGSREGIAQAKSELIEALPPTGVVVLWQEDDFLDILKEKAGNRRVITFGTSEDSHCRITGYQPLSWSECRVSGEIDGQAWTTVLPAVGRHIALNASAAMAVAHLLGLDLTDAASAMSHAVLPPMRMEVVSFNEATVLLDTYNASPPSMLAAIETLAELPVEGRRRAVIGEMRELGDHAEEAHRSVGTAIADRRLDEVLFVGESMKWALEEARSKGAHVKFATEMTEVREFLRASKPGDAVLVKGSRALELEKALESLN